MAGVDDLLQPWWLYDFYSKPSPCRKYFLNTAFRRFKEWVKSSVLKTRAWKSSCRHVMTLWFQHTIPIPISNRFSHISQLYYSVTDLKVMINSLHCTTDFPLFDHLARCGSRCYKTRVSSGWSSKCWWVVRSRAAFNLAADWGEEEEAEIPFSLSIIIYELQEVDTRLKTQHFAIIAPLYQREHLCYVSLTKTLFNYSATKWIMFSCTRFTPSTQQPKKSHKAPHLHQHKG